MQRAVARRLLAGLGGISSFPFYISALHFLYSVHCTHCDLLYTDCILHTRHTYTLLYTDCTLHTLHNLHNTPHNTRFCYFALSCILPYLIVILISVLQLWVYAYFPRLAPVPDEEIPLGVPFSHRFDVRCVRRPRESLIFFRRYFDTITAVEVCSTLEFIFWLCFAPYIFNNGR